MANFRLLLLQFCLLVLILFGVEDNVLAGSLKDRFEQFPYWNNRPPVAIARGDLYYPEWMAGEWEATSTLIEQVAPLAPDIVTPGFEDNQQYLNKAIAFRVRFGQEYFIPQKRLFLPNLSRVENPVVADRVFNGKNIAKAYLGDNNVFDVKVDPDNPNKQITLLRGERRLISTVTGRGTETPQPTEFIATEVTKQLFRSPARIYLNEVETTSDYKLIEPGKIQAEQITAIYLSPQDPDYFQASDRPVAIYRYRLSLRKNKL
ncbi:MAG: hypothetical protein QNJ32_30160 [Xenococcaceae cyanobacterium MO_167.B27]|nr:hypothetical protein [Xenococcaceae cyanobacterium MO_167.B27]